MQKMFFLIISFIPVVAVAETSRENYYNLPKNEIIIAQQTTVQDPFQIGDGKAPMDPVVEQNPFGRKHAPNESGQSNSSREIEILRCGPKSSLGRAEFRKPDLAMALCSEDFISLDKDWLFIIYYVKGFNDFLEERGSFMDSTGACARAAEPRHRLGLVYEVINYILGRGTAIGEVRLKQMLEPFKEDWRRAPFIYMELEIWEREGRLDATSIASRGMCGDPEFQHFWSRTLTYVQRVPGTGK